MKAGRAPVNGVAMTIVCGLIAAAVLTATGLLIAACGRADSTSTSSPATLSTTQPTTPSASQPTQQASTTVSWTGRSTLPGLGALHERLPAPQEVPAVDGWTITRIPGTDRMLGWIERGYEGGQSDVTMSRPAPPTFEASVAVDSGRVAYSALYAEAPGAPQVYVYTISSGEVVRLTDDPPASYLTQLPVQISGDWVAWMRGNNKEDIHLCNIATGETKQFSPHETVVSWRLVAGRLAWQEMGQLHTAQLYLYDPAVGSVQTIDAAYGLLSFDIDEEHIAWAGGPGWNEYYLYDLVTGETQKIAEDSQQNGESVVVKGDILAWTGRTGDRTTLVVHRLDTGEEQVVDEFGPFNPELQSDGRCVAWNRGEEDTGTAVWVYDSKTGRTTDLSPPAGQSTWPSLDKGRIAWLDVFSGRVGQETVMVQDLETSLTTQLTNSRWGDQPPVIDGEHVVWVRRNSDPGSSEGRGVFVATAPAGPPAPAFADLAPDAEFRSAIEWLGERGYDPGYPGAGGWEFRPQGELGLKDFCVLVSRVLPIEVGDESQASTAFTQMGIVRDRDRGLGPETPLSRAQMVSLLVRALDHAYPGLLPAPPPASSLELRFDDPVYGDDLTRAGWNTLLKGLARFTFSGWEWDYSARATRAEAAQLLWNASGAYLEPL